MKVGRVAAVRRAGGVEGADRLLCWAIRPLVIALLWVDLVPKGHTSISQGEP